MTSRTKRTRAIAPVRFASEDDEIQDDDGKIVPDGDEENVEDMITILQQYQKQRTAKSSSRSAAFQQKKTTLFAKNRERAEKMNREGLRHIEQCKAKIDELRETEVQSSGVMQGLAALWTANEEAMASLFTVQTSLIDDLSPYRAREVDAASTMLETHSLARDASRKRVTKNAKKTLQAGIENQKIATDASTLIKHYKALLLS